MGCQADRHEPPPGVRDLDREPVRDRGRGREREPGAGRSQEPASAVGIDDHSGSGGGVCGLAIRSVETPKGRLVGHAARVAAHRKTARNHATLPWLSATSGNCWIYAVPRDIIKYAAGSFATALAARPGTFLWSSKASAFTLTFAITLPGSGGC